MDNFSKFLCLMLTALSAVSSYAEASGYVAIDNGYRWDRISNRVTLGGPTASVKGSTQVIKDINSYQLGGRGMYNFWDCGFIRGEGHYGWTGTGKYSEGGFFGDSKGHTVDGKVAIGYYSFMTDGVWAAPVVGWSYDSLEMKGTNIEIAINGHVFHLSDIKAHQRFEGPFLGFDFLYEIDDCLAFTFGYEFHFSRWHGDRIIQGREYGNPPFGTTTGFSNKRHINRAYGNVFKLDLEYQFCDCWTVGLELKYQFFYGDFGKYKQTRRPILSQYTYANVDGLWWRSFASTITIGRSF